MRKLTTVHSKLFIGLLFLLTLIGCAKSEQPEAAATTEPAGDTAAVTADAAAATTDTAAAATTDTAAATTDTAAAAAPMALDAQISAKLVEVFGEDAKAINITLVDGKAILTGKVKTRSTQELAEQVALYFPEVKGADNQLKAEGDRGLGKGMMKDEAADAALESAAKGALAKEVGEYVKDIEVEAADGMVALRGTVPDATRITLAMDAISKVKDVKKVINLLRVK